ncbi:MAG: cyclase family protein [Desulfobacterales bacterium]
MPVIDLTYPLTTGMPVYPGTPPLENKPIARLQEKGFRERLLSFCSHTGTHMDAPSHLIRQAKTLDQFSADHFIGNGLCIDTTEMKTGVIEWEWLQHYQEALSISEFVLLRTGWGRYWGSNRYFEGYPVLSTAAAQGLVAFALKGVGVDAPSLDTIDAVDYPIHRILLASDTLIIENLADLDRLPEGHFGQLCSLPLHLAGADGAPARVVAVL